MRRSSVLLLRSALRACALAVAGVSSLMLAHTPARAQGAVYRCVDETSGSTIFTDENGRRELAGKAAKCERTTALIATIPGTRPSGAASARPAAPTPEVRAAQAAFPRVEADAQRSRDGERRRILEVELRTEEQRLGRLRADFNNGKPATNAEEPPGSPRYLERVQRLQDQIQRSENNVAALKRELALSRG